jgi:orotidine-5'-phosphate decarboxylase
MREKIIVALDADAHTSLGIAREIAGHVEYVKVGMTLFYAEGPEIVSRLSEMGFKVFLDLKLHDIPHQVRGAAESISRLGVAMFTVHAGGGVEMMRAAVEGACIGAEECDYAAPDVLAVTVLTSMDQEILSSVGVRAEPARQVSLLAERAREAGVQGVVCSPLEAAEMRSALGREALVVTPGVRPEGADVADQARVATPHQAIEDGASHVVIGRPVTQAGSPVLAIEEIVDGGDA